MESGARDALYPVSMTGRLLLVLFAMMCSSCLSSSPLDLFDCPAEVLGDWQIPAGWIAKELTQTEARVEVLTANLSREDQPRGAQVRCGGPTPAVIPELRVRHAGGHAEGTLRRILFAGLLIGWVGSGCGDRPLDEIDFVEDPRTGC